MTVANTLLFKGTAAWANSAAAGTVVNLDVPMPAGGHSQRSKYLIMVTNPSTETALTVRARNRFTDGGSVQRRPELTSFGVAVNTPDGKAQLVEGWMLGDLEGRLALSNDTILGAGGAFTAQLAVYQL